MATYKTKPDFVKAIRLTRDMEFDTFQGVQMGKKGDWLITDPNGENYFCENEVFQMTYELAENDIQEPEPEVVDYEEPIRNLESTLNVLINTFDSLSKKAFFTGNVKYSQLRQSVSGFRKTVGMVETSRKMGEEWSRIDYMLPGETSASKNMFYLVTKKEFLAKMTQLEDKDAPIEFEHEIRYRMVEEKENDAIQVETDVV